MLELYAQIEIASLLESMSQGTRSSEMEHRITLPSFAHLLRLFARLLGIIGAVTALTVIDLRLFHVNSATAAFSFLLLVLGLATRLALKESIIASLASMLAYNFFFLPPTGTFTIADPQNWVALFVFLATAITASQLSSSARRKAEEASFREQEVQRMYNFSRALMLRGNERTLADEITLKISDLFDVQDVSFYDREADSVSNSKTAAAGSPLDDAFLREVARTGEMWRKPESAAVIAPVRLGGRSLGSLGITGSDRISEVALQAIAQLVAIALERARAQDAATRAEVARQNEQLKSTLLDALAHEFKTPLTSIKAAATTVLSRNNLDGMEQDLLTVVDEEADHLNSLVTEAIELARIGSGPVKLHRELCSSGELISSAIAQLRRLADDQILELTIKPDLPLLEIDRKLGELALRQLLNNALKYSAPSSPIQITAEAQADAIMFTVGNAGPGIPEPEQDLIFEKFYRGRDVRARVVGTGMGLTIAREIVEAHGGRIWLKSESGKGVQFSFTLPTIASRKSLKGQKTQTVA
jgi:two-component system, OmpR family, sensor histidine kinase KdpD